MIACISVLQRNRINKIYMYIERRRDKDKEKKVTEIDLLYELAHKIV